jgi:glycosyltransferase involved in cell wall biosynthesis
MENSKLGLVTLYFYPDKASTGKLMTELAIGLRKKGFNLKVYTGNPSYWGDNKRLPKNDELEGVKIERVFNTQFDTRTKSGMILNSLSFFIFSFIRLLSSNDENAYLIVTTPPFLPFLGYFLYKFFNKKYFIILYDLHPEIAIKIGYMKEGILSKFWEEGYKKVFESSSRVIVLGECMSNVMKKKLNEKYHNKIVIIQNWENGNFIKPMEKNDNWFSVKYNLLNQFVVLYSGNLGLHHDLKTILRSAENLKEKDVKFIIIGEGAQKADLISYIKTNSLDKIEFLPFQPLENLPYSMTCSDVIIISQEKGTEGLCVSCKFYTALAAGRPIIAIIGENSEISMVIKKFNCGIVVRDYYELSNAILRIKNEKGLAKLMGENSRNAFLKNFTYEDAINKYYDVISKEIQLI